MKIVLGSDHAGFEAKEKLKKFLQELGPEAVDYGCCASEAVDYPDIAALVGGAVAAHECDRGVLLDGFGGAVCFAANKIPGVRAVCAYDLISAKFAAAHEDCNVICLGGKTHGELALKEILKVWLNTPFEGGRHSGRLEKVRALEGNLSGR